MSAPVTLPYPISPASASSRMFKHVLVFEVWSDPRSRATPCADRDADRDRGGRARPPGAGARAAAARRVTRGAAVLSRGELRGHVSCRDAEGADCQRQRGEVVAGLGPRHLLDRGVEHRPADRVRPVRARTQLGRRRRSIEDRTPLKARSDRLVVGGCKLLRGASDGLQTSGQAGDVGDWSGCCCRLALRERVKARPHRDDPAVVSAPHARDRRALQCLSGFHRAHCRQLSSLIRSAHPTRTTRAKRPHQSAAGNYMIPADTREAARRARQADARGGDLGARGARGMPRVMSAPPSSGCHTPASVLRGQVGCCKPRAGARRSSFLESTLRLLGPSVTRATLAPIPFLWRPRPYAADAPAPVNDL